MWICIALCIAIHTAHIQCKDHKNNMIGVINGATHVHTIAPNIYVLPNTNTTQATLSSGLLIWLIMAPHIRIELMSTGLESVMLPLHQ